MSMKKPFLHDPHKQNPWSPRKCIRENASTYAISGGFGYRKKEQAEKCEKYYARTNSCSIAIPKDSIMESSCFAHPRGFHT